METNIKTDLKNLAAENPVFAIKEIVRRHSMQRGAAIPILQDIQNTCGYVSKEMMQRAAEFSGIPVGELYSIVTFYAQFRLEPIEQEPDPGMPRHRLSPGRSGKDYRVAAV